MPGSFNNITLSATVAEGGNLTVTITPSSALSAATTVRWVIVPKGKLPISSSDFTSLTGNDSANVLTGGGGADTIAGGAGNDIFVLELATGKRATDVVTDFATGDKIQVDVTPTQLTAINLLPNDPAKVALLESYLFFETSNDSNYATGNASNDASVNDTVITFNNGNQDTSDDVVVMVLEDWTADLTFTQFDLV